MSEPRSHTDFLNDIVVAAQKATEFLGDLTYQAFLADEKTIFAVVRALEVIGEAARRIPPEVRDQHPDVPWRAMTGMRDKLIHDYVTVKPEIVWRTVKEDLPTLTPAINRMLNID